MGAWKTWVCLTYKVRMIKCLITLTRMVVAINRPSTNVVRIREARPIQTLAI
jgi:hypothetical protein